MDDSEDSPHVIIDNGSYYIKAGISGEEGPRSVFPSCIGYTPYNDDKNKYIVGTDCEPMRDKLKINYPIEYGVVKNWDDMEKIWKHTYINELAMEPDYHNVMLTILPYSPKEQIEKSSEIMFEHFNVKGLYMEYPGCLSLYSEGKFDGFSIDLGDMVSNFIPILDGQYIPYNITRFDIGGRDITEFVKKSIINKIQKYLPNVQRDIIKDIKEKACYVPLEYEEELKSVEPFEYEMPDGEKLTIKDERIRCPEGLFKSSLIGKEDFDIGKICNDLIKKYKENEQKILYNSIVLSGGNSMFNGLPERLTREIKSLAPYSMKEEVQVIASPERKYSAVNGGCIISSIEAFKNKWITKAEYEESGSDIVYKKCIKSL